MAVTLSLSQNDTFTALRSFLLSLFPANTVEVVAGYDPNVPEPQSEDFIVMMVISRVQLSTAIITYDDPTSRTMDGPSIRKVRVPTEETIQVDIHGPNADNNAVLVASLLRDDYAWAEFKRSGFDVKPLFAGEPRMVPFQNGEKQLEERWSVDMVLQTNPEMSISQDFAGTVTVKTTPADRSGESE